MSQIDWKTELRKIERQYDGLPPEPSPVAARAQKMAERRAREDAMRQRALIGGAGRLLLVATLLGALHWWPYATDCGPDLAALLGAQSMIVVGGLWTAVFAWRHRLAANHTIALVLLVAGLVLVAAQVLPRLGWVTIAGMDATGWRCAATAAR
jgi:hypothetical protein